MNGTYCLNYKWEINVSGTMALATLLIGWIGFAIYLRFVVRKSLTIALGGGFIVGCLAIIITGVLSGNLKVLDSLGFAESDKTKIENIKKKVGSEELGKYLAACWVEADSNKDAALAQRLLEFGMKIGVHNEMKSNIVVAGMGRSKLSDEFKKSMVEQCNKFLKLNP